MEQNFEVTLKTFVETLMGLGVSSVKLEFNPYAQMSKLPDIEIQNPIKQTEPETKPEIPAEMLIGEF